MRISVKTTNGMQLSQTEFAIGNPKRKAPRTPIQYVYH